MYEGTSWPSFPSWRVANVVVPPLWWVPQNALWSGRVLQNSRFVWQPHSLFWVKPYALFLIALLLRGCIVSHPIYGRSTRWLKLWFCFVVCGARRQVSSWWDVPVRPQRIWVFASPDKVSKKWMLSSLCPPLLYSWSRSTGVILSLSQFENFSALGARLLCVLMREQIRDSGSSQVSCAMGASSRPRKAIATFLSPISVSLSFNLLHWFDLEAGSASVCWDRFGANQFQGLQVLHWALEVLLPTELWTRCFPMVTLGLLLHLSQLFNKHCQRYQVLVRPRQRPSPIAWVQTMETWVPASSISMHSSSASSPPEQAVQYDLIDIEFWFVFVSRDVVMLVTYSLMCLDCWTAGIHLVCVL